MRLMFGLALLATGTALSGCVSNTLSSLSNLSTGCSTSNTNVNCGQTPTSTTTTPTTTVVNTNTGNTSSFTTGDTTLALESNAVVSSQSNPAISQLTLDPVLNTMTYAINTKTANNAAWPIPKKMSYYAPAGTSSTFADIPNYAEYRYYQKGLYDEELQVWSSANSYTTQYRDVTNSGTAPVHQAWSFGGNYTPVASMPTANADVIYNGSWTATAQTSHWADSIDPLQTVSHNNNWQVSGTSNLKANFGTGVFKGDLTSTDWIGIDKNNIYTDVKVTSGGPNVFQAMKSHIMLNGKITTSTVAGAKPNQINGTADINLADGWLTTVGSNPMYGGFFGPSAKEVAGVFAVDAALPDPPPSQGSPVVTNPGINNDSRHFLSMSGMFHGTGP